MGYKRFVDKHQSFFFLIIIIFLVIMLIGVLVYASFQISYFSNRITYIEDILNRYINNTYYYPDDPLERINPVLLNTTEIDLNVSSNHYKGVDSFIDAPVDTGAPPGWNQTEGASSRVSIEQTYEDHDKVLKLRSARFGVDTRVDKWLGIISVGTIEYWYLQTGTLFMDQDRHQIWAPNGTIVAEWGNMWRWFSWWNGSTFMQDNATYIESNVWHNVRIDFRCANAPEYMNLTENSYNIWFDDVMLYPNATFNVNTTSIASFGLYSENAISYYDAISWTWGNLEITGELYEIGKKDEVWHGIEKQVEFYFYFAKDFRNIKNFTYAFKFETNITLDSYSGSEYGLYNYEDSDWVGFSPIETSFEYTETTYYHPAIVWFNPSSYEVTHIKVMISTSNVYYDYQFNIYLNLTSWFWIP